MMSTACICLTLYGAGCVFIVLIANMTGSLALAAGLEGVTNCQWMAIVAAILIPLTWMGSPKGMMSSLDLLLPFGNVQEYLRRLWIFHSMLKS